jgi:mannonate dehydratase
MNTKIREIRTILTCPGRNYLIVRVTTEDGITGYGDATLNGRERVVKSVVDDYLADWLRGYDADRISDIWQMVFRGTYWRGGPVLMTALAGVDMALWDIKGKRAGMPLYSLIGGKCRDRVAVYMHAHGQNAEELVSRCKELVGKGIRAIRYSFDTKDPEKNGILYRQPHQDVGLKRIETDDVKQEGLWNSEIYVNDLIGMSARLREALGDHIRLIHDVHGRLTSAQAVHAARELERFSLFFLEDPVGSLDVCGLRTLRSLCGMPLAIGELFNTMAQCDPVVRERLVDFIRVDISHFGGITPLLHLAHFSDACGIKTAFHGPSDISPFAHAALVHVDLSIPNFGIQETYVHDESLAQVFELPYWQEGGYVRIKDAPGLGVGFDEDAAAAFPYKKQYLPILRDETGSIHNW